MENKNEPLLKEEVETFGFLKLENEKGNKKNSKKLDLNFSNLKLDKEIITTGILAIVVLVLVLRTLYAFYIGFKYYDLRFDNNTQSEVNNQ